MKPDPALKGVEGGNCNRTDCQRPEAHYYNVGSRAYYCYACAWEINEFAMRNHADDTQMNLFPDLAKVRHEQRKKFWKRIVQADLETVEALAHAQQFGVGIRRAPMLRGWAGVPVPPESIYILEPVEPKPRKPKAQWKSERQGQTYPRGRK